MNVLLIIGLIVLVFGLLTYFILFLLQKKYGAEGLMKRMFKKNIPNAAARMDIITIILLGVILAGLVMVLIVAFASR